MGGRVGERVGDKVGEVVGLSVGAIIETFDSLRNRFRIVHGVMGILRGNEEEVKPGLLSVVIYL